MFINTKFMSEKAEKFRKATEKVQELIDEKDSKPTIPSGDSGRDENERGHGNYNRPQNEH
jgi:adenine-specific DNA methylase